ncbi:hypothetical protein PMKS-002605 [Pichia membranifaciens]|uniref:CCAAT-binding factor domain-containing protein n=1 Tax=Pichia membranifaciens TaxID=4926 RepID=A0A1Q2YHY6_9ASCO|nr:hypothetical protein PMKS-002605 [Pichia membranifaciens]
MTSAKGKRSTGNSAKEEIKNEICNLEEIEKIRKSIEESPKNYNKLVRLLKNLHTLISLLNDANLGEVDSDFMSIARSLIYSLYRIFSHLISKRLLKVFKGISEQEETVRKWLISKYESFQKELFDLWSIQFFTASIATLKIDVLENLMKLVQDEGKYLGPSVDEAYFPTLRYRKILQNLLVSGDEKSINEEDGYTDDYLLLEFKETYFEKYWDLKFYFFSELPHIEEELRESGKGHRMVFSKLVALTKSAPVYDLKNKEEITEMPVWVENAPQNTMYSVNTFRNNFERTWIGALNLQNLSKKEYSSALAILHKRIIPFFGDAQKLMDFLTASYTLGVNTKDGLLAILALNGLWELMKSYNLEYPNFYTNLYAILTPELLHLKEKSRFFRLLDLFMSSTHLPASIVASFIKRLARLCLTAPPSSIICVIPFIYNLIRKHGHSTCMLLIHSTTTTEEDAEYEDPFDENETDPSKTEALGSSIWELETMINHYHPNVSALVKIFTQHFTKYSYNMEDFLDWSYAKLIDAEMKKRFKGDLGVEFEKWNGMFGDEGYMSDYLY